MAARSKFIAAITLVCAMLVAQASSLWCAEASPLFVPEAAPTSGDFTRAVSAAGSITPFDDATRKALSARALVHSEPLVTADGRELALMLVCSSVSSKGELHGVQLLVADMSGKRPKPIQRIKFGDGEHPEIERAGPVGDEFAMVRMLRRGDEAECVVFRIDGATGKLSERMKIGRGIVDRPKLDIRGELGARGTVEIRARRPEHTEKFDLSHALDALIEDEIYQENGRPIAALVNLKPVRLGWEGEALTYRNGRPSVDVGMALVTPNDKPILTATVTYEPNADGRFVPASLSLAPFMPYSD